MNFNIFLIALKSPQIISDDVNKNILKRAKKKLLINFVHLTNISNNN